MRRVWKWTKRIVLGFVGLVVITVATLLIVIHTDWGRDKVRGIVEDQLSNTFTGGVTIGKLEGSPFGELVARDVTINAADGRPAFKVAALHVKLHLWPLVHKHAHIDELVAQVRLAGHRSSLSGATPDRCPLPRRRRFMPRGFTGVAFSGPG